MNYTCITCSIRPEILAKPDTDMNHYC